MVVVLIAYGITGNKNISSSPIIPIVIIAGFSTYFVRSLIGFKRLLRNQQESMQMFANDNQWSYAGPTKLNDPMLVPPHKYIDCNLGRILYIVDGERNGVPFKLYALQGLVRSLLGPSYTIGYETILRISVAELGIDVEFGKPYRVESNGSMTYVSTFSNLLTRQDIIDLFTAAKLA
jgi:hypothetical protein